MGLAQFCESNQGLPFLPQMEAPAQILDWVGPGFLLEFQAQMAGTRIILPETIPAKALLISPTSSRNFKSEELSILGNRILIGLNQYVVLYFL